MTNSQQILTGQAQLAHHFDTPKQQFASGKLGMWVFLVTEILMFGGLFCLYAVWRKNHNEVFLWGSQFLDISYGALNTVILLLSSFTMAMAVRAAQLGKQRAVMILLGLTLLGGYGFMGVKLIEYGHKYHMGLLPGTLFDPNEKVVAAHLGLTVASPQSKQVEAVATDFTASPDRGKASYMKSCYACHGVDAKGVTNLGVSLIGNQFTKEQDDAKLFQFIKTGRPANDPANKTKLDMPARGGYPAFTDNDLKDIVAHLRTIDTEQSAAESTSKEEDTAVADALALNYKSFVPEPALSPLGISAIAGGDTKQHAALSATPPKGAQSFFSIYFAMTGLHGVHVLIGMGLITWLLVRSSLGHFGTSNFLAVDLIGLYWHLVDLIWIFLFPLLYLIH